MAEAKSGKKTEEKGQEVEAARPRRGLSPFFDMDTDFDRMLENFFGRRGLMEPFASWRRGEGDGPRVDVVDRDDEIIVKAELPGVDKKDLDVSLTDNTVTIKASRKQEEEKEEGEYHRREISSGYYSRTVSLPADVDGNKAHAEFADGMLELKLPKLEEAKRRQIEIK